MARERFAEFKLHTFRGKFPVIETYSHVDAALLYEGDDKPFHITLAVAEVGRVSNNGLYYDEELVTAIETALSSGAGGIRGHVKKEDEDTAFPLDAVRWVGHQRVGEILWAKGYVPPGEGREDIRRKMATGGRVGTSIYGLAIREAFVLNGQTVWRAKEFELESLDLAPATRASLRMGGEFAITKEIANRESGGIMPDTITLADVPQSIREQIIREAKIQADAARVSELEAKVQQQDKQITEMKQDAYIVAEIRSRLGKDANVLETMTAYHEAMTKLAEMFNVPYTNVAVRVEEYHQMVAEMKKQQFTASVDGKIAELTNWNVTTDDGKAKLTTFRNTMRRAVLAEMGSSTDPAKVAETATKLWDTEFKMLAEMAVASLAGPSAIVGSKPQSNSGSAKPNISDDRLAEMASRNLPKR